MRKRRVVFLIWNLDNNIRSYYTKSHPKQRTTLLYLIGYSSQIDNERVKLMRHFSRDNKLISHNYKFIKYTEITDKLNTILSFRFQRFMDDKIKKVAIRFN